jgi:tRNA(fMet)-specific endonuclease VapC
MRSTPRCSANQKAERVRYLLDTDAVVDVLRGRHRVASRLARESPDDIAVSSMTVAELLYGACCSRDPVHTEHQVQRFLDVVRQIPFGRHAASIHARMRFALRQKTVGPNDLVIAATAAALHATVVTANAREFARIEGLSVENWR